MTDQKTQASSSTRLRVLRIAHASLTPALRDRERALAKEYAAIDLEVLTTERWREAGVDVRATEDDLFPVTPTRARFSNHIQLFAYDPRPIVGALRRHRPHLIDLNHEPYSIACAEVLLLRDWIAPEVPIVIQSAQNIMRHYPPPFNWLQRRALQRIAGAYACSNEAVDLLRRKGFEKPVSIIPFGVNTEVFQPLNESKRTEPPTIGFVGRMLPGKGLHVLANALAKLQDMSWRLLIVGDGPERASFERALTEHELIGRTRFTGAVSYEAVPDLYHQMDLLVMPTHTTRRIREQFGRVLVEAMASGVPIVATTCGAIPEVISDAGIVVTEGDADALATGLRRALSDTDLRERLARIGRERACSQYSWAMVAEKTYELYRQVLNGQVSSRFGRQVEVTA